MAIPLTDFLKKRMEQNAAKKAPASTASSYKPPASPAAQTMPAPKAAPTMSAPKTNYGGKGNPYNEILYSKKQYDAGNTAWAKNNANKYYGQLDDQEEAKIRGMNTQQLTDYINSKNMPKMSTPAPNGSMPPITNYTPSYKGPDIAGMTGQLNSIYDNAYASQLQKLKEALQIQLQGLDTQAAATNQNAYNTRNQADAVNLQNQQALKEQMANAGLTTDGQNLTLQAGQNAQRLGALTDINLQRNSALQDIEGKRSIAQNNSAANELALKQQLDSQRSQALFDLMQYGDQQAFNTDQAAFQRAMQAAGLLGTFNGQETLDSQNQRFNQGLAQRQEDRADRTANLDAALQYSNLTGRVLSPQTDWSGLLRQAQSGKAPFSLPGMQFQSQEQQRAFENAFSERQAEIENAYRNGQLSLQEAQEARLSLGQQMDDAYRWANLDWDMMNAGGGSGGGAESTFTPNQVYSAIEQKYSKFFDGTETATPGEMETMYQDVIRYGLPEAQENDILRSIGLSNSQIAAFDKKYLTGN